MMININSTTPHIPPITPPTIAPVLSSLSVSVPMELMSFMKIEYICTYMHTYIHTHICMLIMYNTIQLEGNLIHAHGWVLRIVRVAMQAPAILYVGTHKPIISIA